MPVTVVVEGIVTGHRDQAAEGWPQGVEYLRGRIRPHLVNVNHWSVAKLSRREYKLVYNMNMNRNIVALVHYIFFNVNIRSFTLGSASLSNFGTR